MDINEKNNGNDINVGNMENSIEEDVKSINKGLYELEDSYELYQARWAKRIFENIKEKLEHILSDYKRVIKENEELLELKVSASAHNRILELEKENKELKTRLDEINKTNFPIIN